VSVLAAQPNTAEAPGSQHIALGDGHAIGLAVDELDAAGGAASVAAAGVKLIDAGILFEGEDEPLTLRYFELANAFDCKLGHERPPW